jgi:diketogulonate reductase-like aldo/keto reductase
MEALVEEGLVKSIGLSNFNSKQIDAIVKSCKIRPAVLQVEIHPFMSQEPLVQHAASHGIICTAYSPLGSGATLDGENPPARTHERASARACTCRRLFWILILCGFVVGVRGLFNVLIGLKHMPFVVFSSGHTIPTHPTLAEIGKKYNKSAAQVSVASMINRGIVTIPKSVTAARIQQNFDVFFQLSAEDQAAIAALNQDTRTGSVTHAHTSSCVLIIFLSRHG